MTRKTDPHRTDPWEVAWQDVSSPTSQRISNPQYRQHVEAATEPLADQAAGRIEERLQALLTKRGLVKTRDDAIPQYARDPKAAEELVDLVAPTGTGTADDPLRRRFLSYLGTARHPHEVAAAALRALNQ